MNKQRLFIKKIKSTKGFSLTETLTTLIIMSLVGIMITAGITTSARVYKEITEYNSAQMLYSNTITKLRDELIYAYSNSISCGSDNITFKHVKNGIETIKFIDEGDNKGICIGYGEGSTSFSPIVPYQNNTSLYNDWTVSYEDNGIIKISVSVYKSDGTELIKPVTYDIELFKWMKRYENE